MKAPRRGWIRAVGGAVGLVLVAVVVWRFWLAPPAAPLGAREMATRILAEYLSNRYPDARVLVMGNPFTQRPGQSGSIRDFERAALRGIEKGFSDPARVRVVYPELRLEAERDPSSVFMPAQTTTPLSFLMRENEFDRLVREHRDHRLVISLIGAPLHLQEAPFWAPDSKVALAFLLPDWRLIGSTPEIRDAFRSGKIAAAVLSRPGGPSGTESLDSDYRTEFARRFLLVTPENIEELMSAFPERF
jgi:hypothetical protein